MESLFMLHWQRTCAVSVVRFSLSAPILLILFSSCADAINLAVRFGAPIYVNREIAIKMARGRLEEHNESHTQIMRSCK